MISEITPVVKDNLFSLRTWSGDRAVLIYLSLISLLIHLFINSEFGFHRDEFLYIALGEHLDWGFLEVPPLVAVIAFVSRLIFGHSYFAYHFFPALAGAATVYFTGRTARELGGNRFAQILAACCVLASPAYLRSSSLFQPVVFEQLLVTVFVYCAVRLLKTENMKWWLAVGGVIGIGMMNKYSMLIFCLGLGAGLLVTPARKMLGSRWPWTAALIAVMIFLPNLIWQYSQNWPIFEHLQKLKETQFVHVSPMGFLIGQMLMNLFSLPVWLAGIYFFLFSKQGRSFRMLGWIYAVPVVILLAASGKDYYLLPVYPMLFAGGACLISSSAWIAQRSWIRISMAGSSFEGAHS